MNGKEKKMRLSLKFLPGRAKPVAQTFLSAELGKIKASPQQVENLRYGRQECLRYFGCGYGALSIPRFKEN
jgi:hypothetical protein